MDMGGLCLLIMIYFALFCFVMDPRARCWHIALQMAYWAHAEKEYGVYGRSIEDLAWDVTGMTLIYIDCYRTCLSTTSSSRTNWKNF